VPKEAAMVDVTTYSEARQNFAKLLDRVVKDSDAVIIARKKRGSVVLVSLAEWNSIQETLHLMSTRANTKALMKAMDDLDAGKGIEMTMKELRAFVSRVKREGTLSLPELRKIRETGIKRPKRTTLRRYREAAE
jgi:antitoxin YefM